MAFSIYFVLLSCGFLCESALMEHRVLAEHIIYIYIFTYIRLSTLMFFEALHYKPEGAGSIPDGVVGIFH